MIFQRELVNWYLKNKRVLPWRSTRDAYTIWLSEIILQQTRVEQGLPYFNKFLEHFPTVKDFASASEERILKLWQGLGYYSRGRNMLKTSRAVITDHKGVFPVLYDELIKLKGIGPYTAAAIASFSSGERRAVLDGNVFRVLSRYFGIATPIDMPEGQKTFSKLAQELIEAQDPAVYNQAIMEFGAMMCTPANPDCLHCPVNTTCFALKHKMIGQLPVKQKKILKRPRWFNYFVCLEDGRLLMNARPAGDIWQGLNDLPMLEAKDAGEDLAAVEEVFGRPLTLTRLKSVKHLLTHQSIFIQFFALGNYNVNFKRQKNWHWVTLKQLKDVPMPIVIHDFLETYLADQH